MRRTAPLVWLVILIGCTPTRGRDTAAVGHIFDSLLQAHGQFATTGNVNGLVGHYATDAVMRSNHVEPLRGQAAVRSYLGGVLGAVHIDSLTYQSEGVALYGDSAWQIVSYRLFGKMNGQPLTDHGSGFILWQRQPDGTWRIEQDIVNSSVPLSAPPKSP